MQATLPITTVLTHAGGLCFAAGLLIIWVAEPGMLGGLGGSDDQVERMIKHALAQKIKQHTVIRDVCTAWHMCAV